MKLPEIRIKIPDLPRKVMISLAVLVSSAVLFVILLEVLGGTLDGAVTESARLKRSIDQATRDAASANADYKFVTENTEQFEKLMKGDRLVPHTRRDALKQLQSLAQEHGLTEMTAEFAAANDRAAPPTANQAQTQAQAYRVSVESIKIKLGSPLDGQIYGFTADLRRNFPGSAVLTSLKLSRPPKVTADMLAQISKKGAIVTGEMDLVWRTALANEQKP
ncbi:MAG: hypothetical protein K1X51_01295 [Rhodospirillaceae bacterium]|nr:hypothetical protein [Rhodospirillaceae bacterium]